MPRLNDREVRWEISAVTNTTHYQWQNQFNTLTWTTTTCWWYCIVSLPPSRPREPPAQRSVLFFSAPPYFVEFCSSYSEGGGLDLHYCIPVVIVAGRRVIEKNFWTRRGWQSREVRSEFCSSFFVLFNAHGAPTITRFAASSCIDPFPYTYWEFARG